MKGKTTACAVCGEQIKSHEMSGHFGKEHPEYGFKRERRMYAGGKKSVYKCKICRAGESGFRGLVKHYRKCHPEAIVPPGGQAQEESFESVAEVIGHLNAKVKELKGDNDVLSKSMVELANVLHRTQVEALELQQENDNLARINDDLNNKLVARQGLFQRVMVEARQILGKGD